MPAPAERATRHIDASSGIGWDVPAAGPLPEWAACPYGRHRSCTTGQLFIWLGYDDLTVIVDRICEVWDAVNAGAPPEKTGDLFDALLGHVAGLQGWTG